MSTPRFDMYTLVHKGQRKKLFELTVAVGQLAATDRAAREAFVTDLATTLDAIGEHARAEEEFFGPLYREAAAATGSHLAGEHASLDSTIAALRIGARAAVDDPTAASDLALYRSLASFTGQYLAHIDAEELSMPDLWARFDDATLARTQGMLVASHPPATVQFNLKNMLPAGSPAERVNFLVNLRRNMPAPAFAGVRTLVGALVSANEWSQIDAA